MEWKQIDKHGLLHVGGYGDMGYSSIYGWAKHM